LNLKFLEWLSPRWLSSEVLHKTEVLGLDIGTSAVKMVALHKDNTGYTVDAAAIAEIAAGNDNNQQKINTIRAIHDCLKSAGIRRKLAVCGVSGPEVAVRDFEFPLLPAEEISGAVSLEASQVCPFNVLDSAIDYQLISDTDSLTMDIGTDDNSDNKTRGILVAATNSLVKNKVQLAREASLKCVLMDVDGLALLNCFNELADEHEKARGEQTIAILNAGASNMTIAITPKQVRDRGPFIRDMAYAGDEIIEQIATEKNMPTETVKKILFGYSKADENELHHSLKKACRKVIADIAETLKYYSAQVKSNPKYFGIDRIYVCGGFALVAGFVELLNDQLGIEAVFWNPFDKIYCDKNQEYQEIFSKRGPALAVAAGLAMRSI
jgi:type IV pilus assembly protein PilM